jgi:hypothetical protein
MKVYDSDRILTVRELRVGDIMHGGMLAGKCVKWHVVEKFPSRAAVRVSSSLLLISGIELRQMPFYLDKDCPVCALNYEVKPSVTPELFTIPREILSADVPSSFRFRAAQYGREIKKRK